MVGHLTDRNDFWQAFVARWSPWGRLDQSFGTGGLAVLTQPDGSSDGQGLALQPDGKLLVIGDSGGLNGATRYVRVSRLEGSGQLDPTFGTKGQVTPLVATYPGDGQGDLLAIRPDHRILIAAPAAAADPLLVPTRVALLGPWGGLDRSFGSGGVESLDDQYLTMAVQRDGAAVLGGTNEAAIPDSPLVVTRLLGP